MTGTDLAVTHGSGMALDTEQEWWNDRQIKGLQQLGIDEATQGDLLVFFHVCQKTGLDPFARQIHMVSRNAKDGDRWVKKWTIQTGIDGYRLVADRADRRDGTMREYADTLWADSEGNWRDVWITAAHPTAAKVTIHRNGKAFSGVALYREFVQTKRDGQPNSMWERMPANQLAKCAEALALRKAYPQDLSGIYTDDEMGQANNPEPSTPQGGGLAEALAGTTTTAEQIPHEATPEPDEDPSTIGITDRTRGEMFALFTERKITDRDRQIEGIVEVIGHPIESRRELTEAEGLQVVASLRGRA